MAKVLFNKFYKVSCIPYLMVVLFATLNLHADTIPSYTGLSSDSLNIGEKIELRVSFLVPSGSDITDNSSETIADPIALKGRSLERKEGGEKDSITVKFILTTYQYDTMSIKPITFLIRKDSTVDTTVCETIPLKVFSAIIAQKGDTIRLKDIKSQQKAGTITLTWLWIILATILLTLIAVYLFKKFYKEREKQLPPPIPPFEEAMLLLKELDKKEYIEKGERRKFVFELSEIVKRYCGRIYNINFPEFTTEEILNWLDKKHLEKEPTKMVRVFFDGIHLIKFAGYIPDIKSARELREKAFELIRFTRPAQETIANESTKSSENSKSKEVK